MPIIPLALNSGMFWPRKSWIKKPGTVIFQFLPPIHQGEHQGEHPAETLQKLENIIETATILLQKEAEEAR